MQTSITIASLAGEAYDLFETRTRYEMAPNGLRSDAETFVALKDDAPEWLHELVRNAHGDMLPDDWRYGTIRAALGFISDADLESIDDAHDAASEFADQNVDAYNAGRLAWLSSHLSRAGYCDEAASEFGWDGSQGILGLIGLGQYAESSEVFASVVESLEQRIAEIAEEA